MSVQTRNVVANFFGQGFSALIALAFVPLYLRFLGIEAFGLLGFFVTLQTCLLLLDLGMTSTLNREMAKPMSTESQVETARDLLRSFELIAAVTGIVVACCGYFVSEWLATRWLNTENLRRDVVAESITLMFAITALRFAESIYHGTLLGLRRHVAYNVMSSLMAMFRYAGAFGVLAWVSPSVRSYFVWQTICSAVSVVMLFAYAHHAMPRSKRGARFSLEALGSVRKFAAAMFGVSLLSLLLTQVDKILLSRILSLENFGAYSLATTIAGVVYLAAQPITQTLFPQMVLEVETNNSPSLKATYHLGSQLVTIFTAGVAAVIVVFPAELVFLWTGDRGIAVRVAPILTVTTIGTFMHGLMFLPYHLQLSHRWTSLALFTNVVSVAILVPAILLVVPNFGAVGAAWIWVALNCGYFFISIQVMHRRILENEKVSWYLYDTLVPATAAIFTVLACRYLVSSADDRWLLALTLFTTTVLAIASSFLVATKVRRRVFSALLSQTKLPDEQ